MMPTVELNGLPDFCCVVPDACFGMGASGSSAVMRCALMWGAAAVKSRRNEAQVKILDMRENVKNKGVHPFGTRPKQCRLPYPFLTHGSNELIQVSLYLAMETRRAIRSQP